MSTTSPLSTYFKQCSPPVTELQVAQSIIFMQFSAQKLNEETHNIDLSQPEEADDDTAPLDIANTFVPSLLVLGEYYRVNILGDYFKKCTLLTAGERDSQDSAHVYPCTECGEQTRYSSLITIDRHAPWLKTLCLTTKCLALQVMTFAGKDRLTLLHTIFNAQYNYLMQIAEESDTEQEDDGMTGVYQSDGQEEEPTAAVENDTNNDDASNEATHGDNGSLTCHEQVQLSGADLLDEQHPHQENNTL